MAEVYGTAVYGTGLPARIHSQLSAAQAAQVRRTALRVSVLDTHINKWEEFAGDELQPGSSSMSSTLDKATSVDQSYRWYRLGMGMCILDDGTIVRVRVGDGTYADRNIYVQTITSATTAAQWTSWTLLYSGTHYAVAVVPATASTYHVYAAKSNGIYKNNVLKQSITGVIAIEPVQGQADAMFVTKVTQDYLDNRRVMDHWYSPDIETTAFSDDRLNYRWIRSEMSVLKLSDGRIARAQVAGFYIDPRSTNLAESLTISLAASYTNVEPTAPPTIVRGFVGQAGSNSIINPFLTKMSDGYYYLFYTEARFDADKTFAISVTQTVFWQRSKNLIHWSEPVAIGFNNMNPTGIAVVETGGYAYLANNGAVYRRLNTVTTYDISNYASVAELEMPKQNQPGVATIQIANPDGVNDYLHDLTDCEVKVEAGLLCADGQYRYVQFGRWWIDKVGSSVDRKTNRLTLTLYDLWKRLDNPLRDNYNNVGSVSWSDWFPGRKNELYSYYLKGGTFRAVPYNDYKYLLCSPATSGNFVLYTGVKTHNGDVQFRTRITPNSTRKVGVVYRYTDANNYYWCYSDGSNIYATRVRNGVSVTMGTDPSNMVAGDRLRVVYRWGIHRIYLNGVLQFTYNELITGIAPGFAGVKGTDAYSVTDFRFTDWQPKITTDDLVKTLLAMGDFHDASVGGGTQSQLAVVWGPQTELNTPAKALLSLAEQYKLELAWRNGVITVGQFKDPTVVFSYQNQVLDVSRTEEIGRRINLAVVDGREDSWIEIDGADSRVRGRQIVNYFDVPDLETDDEVRLRAQEEIRKGVQGSAYESTMPLQFDLWRMDGINITNNVGTSKDLKVEGMKITINQSTQPRQEMQLELSPLT